MDEKYSPAPCQNVGGALVISIDAKNAPGQVRSLFVRNVLPYTPGTFVLGDVRYIQIHDVAGAVPANGAVPAFPGIPVAAGGYYESDTPRDCVNGVFIAVSSTPDTLTIALAADCFITAGID